MKKEYVKPVMAREVFVANEYVANCGRCKHISEAYGGSNFYVADDGTGNRTMQWGCGSWVKAPFDLSVGNTYLASSVEIKISGGETTSEDYGSHLIVEVSNAS